MNRWPRFSICLAILFVCSVLCLYGQDGKELDPVLKADVGTVFLKVSISDAVNRSVAGLKEEYFKVYEDKVEQEIVYFEQKAIPVSIGIILDTSPSVKKSEYKEGTIKAISQLLWAAETRDESFLIIFNETTSLIKDVNQKPVPLDDDIVFKSGGQTALYDAIYLGLSTIMDCSNDSKALILITDGEDNISKYSSKDVLEFAKQSNVQIYWIGQMGGSIGYGASIIHEMVKTTSGREFFPNNSSEPANYVNLILFELRNEYVLGYKPTNQARDGKWRRVKVKLTPPKQFPKLSVRVREGYYAHKY